jgi:hypothetical protein
MSLMEEYKEQESGLVNFDVVLYPRQVSFNPVIWFWELY